MYVAYLGEPSLPQFSKFMVASKKDEVAAMRTLAKDCFIEGDIDKATETYSFSFGHIPYGVGLLAVVLALRLRATCCYPLCFFPSQEINIF